MDDLQKRGRTVEAKLREQVSHHRDLSNPLYMSDHGRLLHEAAEVIAALSTPEGFPEGWHLSERATCYVLSEGNNIVGNFVGPDAEQNAARVARMLAAAPGISTITPPRDLRTKLGEV